MKTIQEVIESSTATGERLLAETTGLHSLSFDFSDFTTKEVREAAAQHGRNATYCHAAERFGFCLSIGPGIFIHIYSVRVKIREVIEEEVNA